MHKNLLTGKKILLGVTGSIAIYKALELIRLYVKAGAEVKVLMSEDAKRFIAPLTFETISQNKVLHSETESWSEGLSHIHTGKWADIFVMAPVSVNTINKLSHGIADNLLTQTAIAYTKTILLAPSANTNMMLNPITKESLAKLLSLGYEIVAPQSKLLACNDEGVGALADVEAIFYATARSLLKEPFWCDRDVLISGGGTVEKIDDVRCLTNFSSGKQALSLALCLYIKGANVTLIGNVEAPIYPAMNHLHTKSSHELFLTLSSQMNHLHNAQKTPYLFMVAAVSDYIPITTHTGKLKKEEMGETLTLELKRNQDILATLDKKGFKVIGFKAEVDDVQAHNNAQSMLEKKSLDGVCLNILKEANHFGSNQNEIFFITKTATHHIALADKFSIAHSIVEYAEHL